MFQDMKRMLDVAQANGTAPKLNVGDQGQNDSKQPMRAVRTSWFRSLGRRMGRVSQPGNQNISKQYPPAMEDMRRDGLPIVNNCDFAELDQMSKGQIPKKKKHWVPIC